MNIDMFFKFPGILILIGTVLLLLAIIIGLFTYKKDGGEVDNYNTVLASEEPAIDEEEDPVVIPIEPVLEPVWEEPVVINEEVAPVVEATIEPVVEAVIEPPVAEVVAPVIEQVIETMVAPVTDAVIEPPVVEEPIVVPNEEIEEDTEVL